MALAPAEKLALGKEERTLFHLTILGEVEEISDGLQALLIESRWSGGVAALSSSMKAIIAAGIFSRNSAAQSNQGSCSPFRRRCVLAVFVVS
jgi:hypothetical protein